MRELKTYRVVSSPDGTGAGWLTDFTFPWLDRTPPETRFRGWHTDGYFHFEFAVVDMDLVLDESEDDDQKVLGSDRVELFFSPTEDLSQPYFGLEMEPRGLVYDYRARFHREFDPAWSMVGLTFQGAFTEDGYRVRGRLPLDELRDLKCLKGGRMVTGVYRGEFSHTDSGEVRQDWISWVDPGTDIPDFHIPETFGMFLFEGL